jgi:signal transduction histidine kinase
VTFRTKILLAQTPLALALVLIAFIAVRTTASLSAAANAILEDNYRSVLAAQRMQDALEALDRAALVQLAGHGPLNSDAVDRDLERFATQLAVQNGNVTEPGEQDASADLSGHWDAYRARFGEFRALAPPAAATFYFEKLAPEFRAVHTGTERILALNQDAMLRKSDAARERAVRSQTVMIAAVILAVLFGLATWSVLTERLMRPVLALRTAADRIGSGDFGARVAVTGKDEFAQLATTFNSMADRLDRYRRSSLGELLLAQQAAQAAIDSLPDTVIVFDAAGEVLIVNGAGEMLLGIAAGSGSAAALQNIQPTLRALIDQARSHVLSGKGAYVPRGFEDAARIPSSSDGDQYYLARATPVYSEQGHIAGATVILQDVTRLHRFDELKNDLVATVAHEFRTPLTSLRMAIHLCLEQIAGPLNEKQSDLLYAARDDCERLQRIVDELLDLARLQGGRMELHRRRVPVRSLVEAAVDAQRAFAANQHIELKTEVAPAMPEIDIDADRIELVFANLLTNAIRHSPVGAAVQVRGVAVDSVVRFEVIDHGPGIAPDQREAIFEKFAQGERRGGAGLGLSIAREIVTAHGGTIGVDSEVGRGSTFWFTIPSSRRSSSSV